MFGEKIVLSDEWIRLPTKVIRNDFYYKDQFFEHYVCDLPAQNLTEEEIAKYVAENLEKVYRFVKCGEL